MLRFHIDALQTMGSLQLPTTVHLLEGQVETDAGVEQALFLHPHAHDGLAGPACPWMPGTPTGVTSLSPQSLEEVSQRLGHGTLAAVASCAREAGGHITFWRDSPDA